VLLVPVLPVFPLSALLLLPEQADNVIVSDSIAVRASMTFFFAFLT
jgi:hypothetical protein